ncbi:MAG: asparagine synthetase B, partial [Acutalibacteraceae bacterium]
MCSIMSCEGKEVALEEFEKGFCETKSRGPDMSKIIETENGILGFHRLAIMGLDETGMQPFSLHGNYVVCNGEIYCFRPIKEELSKEYTFVSDSDCEILLPMYEKYGTDMFQMLDAEFAMVI